MLSIASDADAPVTGEDREDHPEATLAQASR
jgi:hypothetical protein